MYYKFNKHQQQQTQQFIELLLEWNKKINLTRITDYDEIITKHIQDSLSLYKSNVIKSRMSIIDVGTGAGFPGIPLAISDSTLKVTLLDSLNKRVTFLNQIISELPLENVKAVHGRAEDMAHMQDYRERFDIATARAVAPLPTLVELCLPFVAVGGYFLCMKGPNTLLHQSENSIHTMGGIISENIQFHLDDFQGSLRNIIVIKKCKKTLEKFPRKPPKPSKSPIL